MMDEDYAPSYHFGIGVEQIIPFEKYPKLCSCVFCWNCFNGIICENCAKLYCSTHTENHMCFKENILARNPITSGKLMEIMV